MYCYLIVNSKHVSFFIIKPSNNFFNLTVTATSGQSQLTPELKKRLCYRIFYPRFDYQLFRITQEYTIDPELNVEELKDKYSDNFDDIFEVHNTSMLWVFNQNEHYELVNKSKARTVFINGSEHTEDVFTCLVRNDELNYIKAYYVPDYDYNINEALRGEYVVGRFIFSIDTKSRLILHALAEEYAVNAVVANLLNPAEIKSYYLERRGSQSSSKLRSSILTSE